MVIPHDHVSGDGPDLLLVHGVGIGAWSFRTLTMLLAPDWTVHAPDRRGYGEAILHHPAESFEQLVDDVTAMIDALPPGTPIVGVSGGATLTLAAAIRVQPELGPVLIHEPLIGPLAADLHAAVCERVRRLGAAPDLDPAGFVAELVGVRAWNRLGRYAHDQVAQHGSTIRNEAPLFTTFEPTLQDLARLRCCRLTTTIGEQSPHWRHDVADLLAEVSGAAVASIDNAKHLVQCEAPDRLTRTINTALAGSYS